MGDQKAQESEKADRIDSRLIPPRSIRQRHLESNLFAIKIGLESERPETTTETKFYFSTDTLKLSYFTGVGWVESAALS